MNNWTKEIIQDKIWASNQWLERGILAIFDKQTRSEQATESTNEWNGVGFNHAHAHMGSYYAKWILSGKHLNGIHLVKGRKMMLKYSGQLAKIANGTI